MMNLRRRTGIGLCAVAVSALVLGGCANSEQSATRSTTSKSAKSSASASASAMAMSSESKSSNTNTPVTFSDAYIRAVPDGADMTAIFGTLKNTTDKEITITGFSSNADAGSFELHEVVDGQMQQKEGGFVIPANGTLKLEPGHEHFMLMGLKKPIKAGEKFSVKAELSDGTSIDLGEIAGREVAAGAENYGGAGGEGNAHGAAGNTEHNHSGSGDSNGGTKTDTQSQGNGAMGAMKTPDSSNGNGGSGDSNGAGAGANGGSGDGGNGGNGGDGGKHGGKHHDHGDHKHGEGAGAGNGGEKSVGIRG